MAKNPIRALPSVTAVVRWLCTASTAATETASAACSSKWKPLYRRLSPLGGAPDGSVSDTLDRWLMEGRKVSAPQLMRHVRELRKYRRHKEALEMMNWMEMSGLKMSIGSNAVRLDLVSRVEGIDSAEKYFSTLPDPAKHCETYGALLNCYCKENMADKAIALYEKMKEKNLAFKTLVYNNLMSLYMKLGQLEKVPTLFQEMKASNIFADNCTYRILMKSHASMDDIESVEKLTQEMEGIQGALDWFTYCHLAAIYNSTGLFEKAETALKKAELVINSRDLSPFRFLISLYAGAGNIVEVKRVWELLKSRIQKPSNTRPLPTNTNYLIMLQALKKLDDIDALKQCFEEWEAGCVYYDIKVVNTVIAAYLRKSLLEEAESLQEKAAEKGARSDIQTFVLFVDYYLKSRDFELAWKCSEAATNIVKRGRTKLWNHDDQ